MQLPVSQSQTFAVQSAEDVTMQSPEAENAAELTPPLCPENVRRRSPFSFQAIAVPSCDAVIMAVPSGEYFAVDTAPSCPVSMRITLPDSAFHNLATLSCEVVTTVDPSGEKAAELTWLFAP